LNRLQELTGAPFVNRLRQVAESLELFKVKVAAANDTWNTTLPEILANKLLESWAAFLKEANAWSSSHDREPIKSQHNLLEEIC